MDLVPTEEIDFSSLKHPDRLWGPPSFVFNVYGFCDRAVKLSGSETDHHPNLLPRVRDELFTLFG